MFKRNRQKINQSENADKLIRQIFISASLREDELDRFAEGLSLRARSWQLASEKNNKRFWLLKPAMAVLAGGAAGVLFFLFLLYLAEQPHNSPIADLGSRDNFTQHTSDPDNLARSKDTPQLASDSKDPGRAPVPATQKRTTSDSIDSEYVRPVQAMVNKKKPTKPAQSDYYASSPDFDAPFLPVNYADGLPPRMGSIVRVELPRSALVALGLTVPLENSSPTVKAELLLGSDGVTRGIRIVE